MKIKSNYLVYSTLLGIILLSSISTNESIQVFAQTVDTKFTVRNAEQISKDPFAKSLLEKIEQMKQRLAEVEEAKKKQQEHQKFIDQQRELVKQKLAQDISRMHDKYKDYTPKAAFTSFVSSKPIETHNVYWDMFNYQQQKVIDARKAMKIVLENGGSLQDARNAYHNEAAIKRVTLIEITKNLNVKYGLADEKIQSTFDKYGKLPRYD
jgi:anion-transporting  ArsA/GET3 family ATPase